MTSHDTVALLHLLGFVTGISLYALLAVMTVRGQGEAAAFVARVREDPLPLATAVLGLLWNAGALVVYALRDLGLGAPAPWLAAVAFAALGCLPAVVVHAALRGVRHRAAPVGIAAAYLLSGSAALLHVVDAARGVPLPSRPALLSLTVGYGVLMAALVLGRWRLGGERTLSAVALAVFAVMALHLGYHAETREPWEAGESWLVALLGHHASLPLAFAILYQDYRFALADAFLKRALSLIALVALASALYALVAAPLLAAGPTGAGELRAVSVVLTLWVVTALAYPALRDGIAFAVDRVILRRLDYRQLRAAAAEEIEGADHEEDVLDAAARTVARALTITDVHWQTHAASGERGVAAPLVRPAPAGGAGATVLVPTTDDPAYLIEVGGLAGGRRLLSDDVTMLEAVALLAGRRVDALRVTHERCARDIREAEMGRLATEAELRALRAQINPHFLFNTLTTLGYLMQAAPERALSTLYNLTDLLRAVLHRSAREFCSLAEEVELVEAYLAIEGARFEERLRVEIDVPGELADVRIPPLLLQPLVENAVKHGVAPSRAGGDVRVSARTTGHGPVAFTGDAVLCLSVSDTGAGASPAELRRGRERGVGLANVEQRLRRYYGDRAALAVRSVAGEGTTVEIWLPVAQGAAAAARVAAGAA